MSRLADTPWTADERRRWQARFPNSEIRTGSRPVRAYPQVINKELEKKRRALLLKAEGRRALYCASSCIDRTTPPPIEPVRITAASIREAVVEVSSLSWAEIISPRRARPVAYVRMATAYLIKKHCPHLSLPWIGRLLGGRDHSTIMHATKLIEAHRERSRICADYRDPRIDDVIENVERRLGVAPAKKALGVE